MSKRLHIVLFDGSLATTTFIERLAEGLAKHHQVSFIGFGGNPKNRNPAIGYYDMGSSAKSVALYSRSLGYAFRLLVKKGSLGLLIKALPRIFTNEKNELKQQNFSSVLELLQPDILHVQWPSLLPWCEETLNQTNIKVVLSQRGYQNNVRPFVNEENFYYLKKIYPQISGFHSVSKAMVETGNKIFSSPDKIDRVVYSGFNFEALTFRKNYEKSNTLALLSIGRPHWIKGYAEALKACRLLKTRGVCFTYTIVGALGNEELLYRIHEYGLDEAVVLTGKISQKEVYDLMLTKDVLLFPSIAEGLPNVVLEAMVLGVPVIATDCGGVSELIDETTGILIPTRDATAMAQAILSFTETPIETINERRLQARKRVVSRHSEEQMVYGMEGLYFEVLGVD